MPEARRADPLVAVLGASAVLAGAFGAHALGANPRLDVWRTAALYHLVHAVALLAPHPRLTRHLFVAGIAVFSGSLYLLVLLDQPALGAITPVGGVLLVAGWVTRIRW
jgi:uncharacterized membrane protein YgdD (TMEM256/DUF423 family)